jgi:hypothetical protein
MHGKARANEPAIPQPILPLETIMRIAAILLLPLASACSMQGPAALYAGPLQPLAGTCDPAAEAELTIRDANILFAPATATLVLRGHRTGAILSATAVLPTTNHQSYPLQFQGEIAGSTITGTYQTPRCRYSVRLHRTQD